MRWRRRWGRASRRSPCSCGSRRPAMQTVTGLQYSCCNEDSRSELEALAVRGGRALSIHAAGGRAFSLLLGDPDEVVAIDRNPAQIHLGRLKVAAMRRLDRD